VSYLVASSEEDHAALAAELMARAIHGAVQERGVARVALSGGTTPAPAYRRLAEMNLDWERTEWFWVDERAVSPTSDRSNFRHAVEDLHLGPRAAKVFRMEADAPDLEGAARRYEEQLRASFGVAGAVRFDVMTLGVGVDGHTASLFPGTGAVEIDDRLVAVVHPTGDLEPRMTLTAPVLREAAECLVLCRGAAKRDMVVAAGHPGPEDVIPARLLLRASGQVTWICDQAAAP
jgi:6-phosphogluconolactonase